MKPLTSIKQNAFLLLAILFLQFASGFIAPANAFNAKFYKSGHQTDCDYVEYKLTYNKPFFGWLDEGSQDTIVSEAIRIRDVLPEGLSIQSATIAGDVTGPGGGLMLAPEIKTTNHANDTLVWKKLHLSKTDLDGLGNADDRQFTITILAKIDKSKFLAPKMVSNQAKASGPATVFSHDLALPEDGDPVNGEPTLILIDVSDCPDDTGSGDPIGEACFKVEHGEIECDPKGAGVFIYKMNIGPEYGGKVIELVSTTPGVSIFPPSQIVPAGGGVLAWTIHGAVPGMSVHLVANGLTDGDVKHVAGPKDGLGLCCVQKIIIVIPVDIDCPPPLPLLCENGDEGCLPPSPPPPPCDPEWEDCLCDPKVEKCDPPENKKPKLQLDKRVINDWCLPNGDGTATCNYTIRIWNAGAAPFNGPVTVRDRYPNGAPISSTFNPVPPWVCGPDGAADKFVCTGNVNLPPFAVTSLTVNAIVSIAGYPSREVENCAMLKEQAGQPKSCAIAKLPVTDPKQPNLKLTKNCKPAETLTATDGSGVVCKITVTNNGAAAAFGPISINDVTTLVGGGDGAITIDSVSTDTPAADWTCSAVPADNLNCSIDGTNVGPGVSRSFVLTFSNIELSQQRYKNCVKGLVSGGGDVHTFDSVCVEGGADPAGPKPGEDPNDISVEKTGDSICDSKNPCHFEITLKNGNNKDFSGKLAIIDGITDTNGGLVAGAAISVSPPFGCALEPTSLPFGCVADVTLGAGQSRTHKVIVMLPQNDNNTPTDASVPLSSQNGMRNCVLIGEAGILSADIGDTLEGAGSAQANEGSPRYACHDFNTKEPRQCTSGMVLNKTGKCQCPSGTRWNGRRCFGDVPPIRITDPIPPITGKDPVCPRGMNHFRSFKGKPLGYALRNVRSNGHTIICGEPRCDRGWSLYHHRSTIPRGWTKKQIGRPNSKYKFWCAKAAKKPSLQCWNDRWTQISSSQIHNFRAKRYTVKPRSKNGQTIWCAKPGKTPPVQCWSGWKQINDNQIRSYEKNGYDVKPRGTKGKNQIWCAKHPIRAPLECWSGWTKVWLGEIAAYKHKGYDTKSRGRGKRRIWCVKPGKPQRCVPGPNEYRNKQNQCVCKRNYHRGSSGICLKNFTAPQTCDKPWKQIMPGQIKSFKNKGWKIKHLGGSGVVPVICTKPGTKQCKANEQMTSRGCLCKRGYQRDKYRRCVKKPTNHTLNCRKGWSKVPGTRVNHFKKKGYSIQSRGKGKRRIWCVKPGNKPTGPTISCSGGGKPMRTSSSVKAQWYCSCPTGKKAVKAGKSHYRCVNKTVPQTCAKGQTKVTSSKAYRRYKKLGWTLKRKKGYWCGRRPIIIQSCTKLGKIGKWPKCYNKPIINYKPKITCESIGKVGKWPKCYPLKKPSILF
ncbi:MAG: hypothetical protein GY927_06100 [bacterium]|nr:hypothetical protein [bacterium]